MLEPLRHKLPALCRVLFEPFARPGKYDHRQWNLSERVRDVLGDDRLNFRIAGPPRLLFFMRAFHGLCFYLRQLDEPICWSRALSEIISRHDTQMAALELRELPNSATTYGGMARHLCIRVTEAGEVKAKITLPAAAVERLGDFVDDDLRSKIDQRGIKLDQLVRQVRNRQCAPQDIFELKDQGKQFAVWLE